MSQTGVSNRRPAASIGVLILAAALLGLTVYLIFGTWEKDRRLSRVQALSEMIAIRSPLRLTDTPGLNAWLGLLLHERQESLPESFRDAFLSVIEPGSPSFVPRAFLRLRQVLADRRLQPPQARNARAIAPRELGESSPGESLEFRVVQYFELEESIFVVSRRAALAAAEGDDRSQASPGFLQWSIPHLRAILGRWTQESSRNPLAEIPGIGQPRVARLYTLSEDGTFVSLPLPLDDGETSGRRDVALTEGRQLKNFPNSPTLVSNGFFFNYRYDRPLESQLSYSGLYLDVAGLGFVATIGLPLRYPGNLRGVLAVDITFDVDWNELVAAIPPPMRAEVAQLDPNLSAPRWNPWSTLGPAIASPTSSLRGVVEAMAAIERTPVDRLSVHHAVTANGESLAAVQMARSTWLILWVPKLEHQLPWLSLALAATVVLFLLARAERARQLAQSELDERQNLLNTMKVPLSVVDPNTDRLIYCNEAAGKLGMRPGLSFGKDVVVGEEAVQEHYRRTQAADESSRRAYGVPIRVRGADRELRRAFLIVRSVAVTAPIREFRADQRHRLAIMFLVEEEPDLTLLVRHRVGKARENERRLLSGLLSHGVEVLAQLVSDQLERRRAEGARDPKQEELLIWLSEYVRLRIEVVAWLLERWGQARIPASTCLIEVSNVTSTLTRMQQIFEVVRAQPELRTRLHWENGVLSQEPSARDGEGANILDLRLDWDEEYCLPVPTEGCFGLFLGEALVNAISHGRPGSRPRLCLEVDPNRQELLFELANPLCQDDIGSRRQDAPYGGQAILQEIGRLCGWDGPTVQIESEGTLHVLRCRMPVSRRKGSSESD